MFDFGSLLVRISVKILFLVVMISFFNLFAEDNNKDSLLNTKMNTSAQKTEIFDKEECYPLEESYKRFVFEARYLIMTGKDRYVKRYFEKHLVCWNDKDVYNEFAEFYESKQQFYLAGIQHKKAENMEKYNAAEQKRAENLNNLGKESFRAEYIKSLKNYKIRKVTATTMFFVGSLTLASGLGLFIHGKAGGENSLSAQYSLMLGGLSLIAGGVAVDMGADHAKNFYDVGIKYAGNDNTLPKEFYYYSGAQSEVRKISAKSLKKHGAALMIMSIPMFAIAAYGFYDNYKYSQKKNSDDEDSNWFDIDKEMFYLSCFFQTFSFLPAITSLIVGSIMLVKASNYEKLSTEPSILTLNSITPVIDPVSKTYGLSMGFSF